MILITGAAGFIGSHLTEKLLDSGEEIVGIDNLCDFYDIELKKYNLEIIKKNENADKFIFIEEDIRNLNGLETIFNNFPIDTIIHLAAMAGVRPSIEDPILYQEVNVRGTQNLLECSKKNNVKKFIFASSSSVYGNNKKIPFAETDNVDHPISPYAATKKAGELLCYTYHEIYDIDMICLRFFTVYGPRQRPDLAIHKFARMVNQKKPIPFYGDGTTARDYTFINDIVDGLKKSLKWIRENTNIYEIINLGNNEPVKLSRLVEVISNHFNYEIVINRQPIPKGDVMITFADISKARNLFGYDPKTSIESGLDEFFKWFHSYY